MVVIDGIIYSLQKNGGISVYFNNLLDKLTKVDYQLILYQDNYCTRSSLKVENRIGRIFERYRDVNLDDKANPTVFHSSYYRLPSSNNLKVVTTVHDFTYERYVKGFKKKIHTFQKFRAIRNSDAVICISESTANDLMEFCPIDEKKIHVVHNGVSDLFTYNKDGYDPEVIFVGARSGYKNFDLAVKAVSQCQDLSLTIVGGGDLSKFEYDLLNRYLPGRYFLKGYVNDQELNYLYNKALCLLYPSLYEGFGIPVIEAMKCGCPVISMNASSIPEVAGGAALLLDNTNVNEWSYAIKSLLNTTERSKLVSLGLVNALRFSWDKTHNKTIKIYNKFL